VAKTNEKAPIPATRKTKALYFCFVSLSQVAGTKTYAKQYVATVLASAFVFLSLSYGSQQVSAATVSNAELTPAALATDVPTNASSFVLLPQTQRVLDTRNPGQSIVEAGGTRTIMLTGPIGVLFNASVTAAVVNVTVVGPAKPGYWTLWPTGQARPNASQLNVDDYISTFGGALALPNLVTVPVVNGGVSVYSSAGGNVVVDLVGYYTPSATATSSGRLVTRPAPTRIYDSRNGSVMIAGETRAISVPDSIGTSAVVLSVTVIGLSEGYWQVFPSGEMQPDSSNLNSLAIGAISANQVITSVNQNGAIDVFSSGGGHVIVDVVGSFTDSNATASTDGLFVPLDSPSRFLDTRASGRIAGTGSVEVDVQTQLNHSNIAAVALNATIVDAFLPGYVSVTPAGSSPTESTSRTTSTTNTIYSNQTVASHAIVPVSARGFDVFTEGGGQLLADISGWYTGTPQEAPFAAREAVVLLTATGCVGVATWPVGPIRTGSGLDAVKRLQYRLLELGFWNAGIDGIYGLSTKQAVMAFQKWTGLTATSVTDATTAAFLNTTQCKPVAGRTTGDFFEVDKTKQIAFVVRDGKVVYTFNVSTGNGKDYDEEDQRSGGRVTGVAITPSGDFKIYKERDEKVYEGTLGSLYRPKFVVGGIAVHGSRSIPAYPASHGCIRVANPVMDLIWLENLLPQGAKVWIHD
jgi:peptidoglycan hydrolase-like protein with peptidoglycan-binding domain